MQRIEMSVTLEQPWASRSFPGMGTTIDVLVGGDPELVDFAVSELGRLESLWSRFDPESDVSRLNAADGGETVVAEETIDLLEHAIDMWKTTSGRFDPTVIDALEVHGYDETFERVRARATSGCQRVLAHPPGHRPLELLVPSRGRAAPAPGCSGIVIDRHRRRIRLPAGVRIDFGGIGKGYAADRVAEELVQRGAAGACVAVGGDVRAAGCSPFDGRPWPIDVEDPCSGSRVLFTLDVRDGGVVTSTRLLRRWQHGGRWRHHLIDPATGEPCESPIAAVIVADDQTWRAEAWAKAVFVAGLAAGPALLDEHGLRGWIVQHDGRCLASNATQHRVTP
jgi:thiamine biosynthesis lipoprotein